MKLHKLATLFPEITGDAFKALALDIKSRGLRHKITTLDGKILDGVNRHRACISSGVEPEFEEYDGDDPLAFVLGENLNRRHLTDSQRAAIAAKIATAKPGGDREHIANPAISKSGLTIAQAANKLNVTPRQVSRAKAIAAESQSLANKVRDGKISLNAASEQLHPTEAPQESAPETPQKPPAPVVQEPSTTETDAGFTLLDFRKFLERQSPTDAEKFADIAQQFGNGVTDRTSPLQIAQFTKALHALEAHIPDGDEKHHEKYGVALSAAAERQMNKGNPRKSAWAYA